MEHESQPGLLKRNAGWLLAGLLAVGSLSNGVPVSGGGATAVAGLAGMVVGTIAVGAVAQHINNWNQ